MGRERKGKGRGIEEDEELRAEMSKYSLVIEIKFAGSRVSTLSIPPVIKILHVETMAEFFYPTHRLDHERLATRDIEFFTSVAESCVRKWENE